MARTDEIYVEAVERVLALAGAPGVAQQRVPACPDWTVHDVVAHVTGLAADIVAGTMPFLDILEQWRDESVANARDTMTAREVEARRDRSIDDIGVEWRAALDDVTALMRGERAPTGNTPQFVDMVLVTDLAVHEHDIRGAIGDRGARDIAGVGIGLATYGFGVGYRLDSLGLPSLTLKYDDKERVLGSGDAGATVSADKFELFRAFAGRRSRKQIESLDWHGDPTPYLALIPAYGERADALEE